MRSLGKRVSVNAEGDLPLERSPMYSPPTTTTGGCSSSYAGGLAMGTRRSHVLVLLLVLGLVIVSGIVIAGKETKLGLDLQGA